MLDTSNMSRRALEFSPASSRWEGPVHHDLRRNTLLYPFGWHTRDS